MIGTLSLGRSRVLIAAATLIAAICPITLLAQEDRENLIVNSNGTSLLIHDTGLLDDSADLGIDLRLQPLTGGATVIAEDGESVVTSEGSFSIVGFGASPDLNDNGLSTFMSGFGSAADTPDTGQGVFRATAGGVITLLAQAWGNADGTAIGSDTICHFEPMPAINNPGQVAFGFNSDISGGVLVAHNLCQDLNAIDAGITERKGVARWTSPGTLIKFIQTGDAITVGAPFRGSSATYNATKTGFTHMGGKVFNDSGHAVADVLLDNDLTVRADTAGAEDPEADGSGRTYADDRNALVYLRGPSDYLLIAATGPDSMFQELMQPVMNDNGVVLFKGEEEGPGTNCGLDSYECNELDTSLNLWSVAGGLDQILDNSDGPPNSDGTFQGFSPHYEINNAGQVLFSSGLTINGNDDNGDSDSGDYRVVVLRAENGSLRELARTTAAANDDTGTGPFTSSADGFDFQMIGSSTILTETGNAFFIAETYDDLGPDPCTGTNLNWIPDGDEVTAVIGWSPNTGNNVLMQEGEFFEDTGLRIMRIYPVMSHLRDQTDDASRIVVKIILDADNDCVVDDPDDTFGTGAPAVPTANAVLPAEIPTLSTMSMLLFGLLLAGAAMLVMKVAS